MAQKLGNVAVGQVLKLKESGAAQNYLVVQQGRPSAMYDTSCDGTWLLRRDIMENQVWASDNVNKLESSDIQAWLQRKMLAKYDSGIQTAIQQVKIPYRKNGGVNGADQSGSNGLSCKLFLLSGYEIGLTANDFRLLPVDGAKLTFFESGDTPSARKKRIANLSDSADVWWLRSPASDSPFEVHRVNQDGSCNIGTANKYYGVRPALVLPPDLIVDDDGNILPDAYPNPPASITVPSNPVATSMSISVSWPAVSGVSYKLQRSVNSGGWGDIYSGDNTSYQDTAGLWETVQYRVASVKNGIVSGYTASKVVTVLPYNVEKLTVPSQAMMGQKIPISWSPAAAATSYILERKPDSGTWTQIYSGSQTAYSDTPEGGWTSVQYRVKAGKNGTFGAWTTSVAIPVLPASALVVSGQDGDLGDLTADVPYTVSTDTGNPITVERRVNGQVVAKVAVKSNFSYEIPVYDLPTGSGTIVLTATVQSGSAPVTATRTWTYNKPPVTYPASGGPAQLTQDGKNVFPPTLAECVRVPTFWGGTLDKALELLRTLIGPTVISVGTYVGTGTFGSSNPNTLTFDSVPTVVTVYGDNRVMSISNITPAGGPTDAYIQGKTAKWYGTSADRQLNVSGVTYTYVAIGKEVQS